MNAALAVGPLVGLRPRELVMKTPPRRWPMELGQLKDLVRAPAVERTIKES